MHTHTRTRTRTRKPIAITHTNDKWDDGVQVFNLLQKSLRCAANAVFAHAAKIINPIKMYDKSEFGVDGKMDGG